MIKSYRVHGIKSERILFDRPRFHVIEMSILKVSFFSTENGLAR